MLELQQRYEGKLRIQTVVSRGERAVLAYRRVPSAH